ncbi:MAG TPA: hypothetical protein DEO40_00145 [Treponema sp.]|jgi:hypothetical protein|nr:hypothetical protein [Treponema sp.]HBB42105.1 hypothetical protein [Treponema sp.]HCA19069.1 hypothetical protein [Treponema sp.]
MNTIPLIFNQRTVDRTILGGVEQDQNVSMPVTCLILNRNGNKYRSIIFDRLIYHGFEKVICVEAKKNLRGLDELSQQYPTVKFMIPHEHVTPGDMMNLGMGEAKSPYVLVLQDDLCTESFHFPASLAKKLIDQNQFCVCPRLATENQQTLPVHYIPSSKKSVFTIESTLTMATGTKTFYASDWAGFYNRDKFIQLGGADYTIDSEYWQKLDLFFRSWLWGETTTIDSSMLLTYSGEVHEEDMTAGPSYMRFYLKNLLPVFGSDHAEIPVSSFFAFRKQHFCGFRDSVELFRNAKNWTLQNRYRFKTDAVRLIENWGNGDIS